MDLLWAPWRQTYVRKVSAGKNRGCVFCRIRRERADARNLVFVRTRHSYGVLNLYPFNGGHVLVVPNRHAADLEDLSSEERADLFDLMLRVRRLMARALKPEAFNVGLNLGAAAGAGIPDHLHIHIVPRWRGDVNFMPAVFGTKVIPVSLRAVYKALKNADAKRY